MTKLDTQALKRITSTILSYTLLALFAWAIYPYKGLRLLVWRIRLERAKSIARSRAAEERKAMYVIQSEMKFKVQSRAEARRINTRVNKRLEDKNQGYLRWDYRNGLVFIANPDGTEQTIDRTPKRKTTKKKEEKK